MNTFVGCSVIIYNDEGRVFIAQRSELKKKFPLKWETVGGGLEPNETPEECIRRETKEEIGCELHNLKLLDVYVVREDNEQHVSIVYTGKIKDRVQANWEIANVEWISENDIGKFEFYDLSCKKKIEDFFRNYKKIDTETV